jgi:hemolysin III
MYHGERFNSITHLLGLILALAGLVVLVSRAVHTGDSWKVVSFSIYGGTLVALYLSSALYHSIRGSSKQVLQKFDHSTIYLLIAGSYTPFTLVTLRGIWGWSLFGVVWGLAVIGIIQDLLFVKRRAVLSVAIYLLMGWICLFAIRPLSHALPRAGMIWLVAGGLFYTIGVVFFALDKRLRHGHGIWHLFVLAGSVCHYLAIFLYVS